MSIDFNGQVAIVTGAGNGLGKSHALALAARGAKVVVNDFGGARDGTGGSTVAAQLVVDQIKAAGGEALANDANVTDEKAVAAMVDEVMNTWDRIDILVNNAGILRDKTFSNMQLNDFREVLDVHLMGTVICTKTVWDIMKGQKYGRVVVTTSSTGLYGNFGQTNYGAAKLGLVGFIHTLVQEGGKYGIRANALSPVAATRLTEDLIDFDAASDVLSVEPVSAGLLALCHKDAPNRMILACGAGMYAQARIVETEGVFLAADEQTPENIMALLEQIGDASTQKELMTGAEQSNKFVSTAMNRSA